MSRLGIGPPSNDCADGRQRYTELGRQPAHVPSLAGVVGADRASDVGAELMSVVEPFNRRQRRTRFDARPCVPEQDVTDVPLADAEAIGNLSLVIPGQPHGSDVRHVRDREAGCGAQVTSYRTNSTTLGGHVRHVFALRSEEQMIRAYARRIVAAMAHLQPFRDRAVPKGVGDTVRALLPSADGGQPVAKRMTRPGPYPALIAWSNLPPKPRYFSVSWFHTPQYNRSMP